MKNHFFRFSSEIISSRALWNCTSSTVQRLTYNIYNITYNILKREVDMVNCKQSHYQYIYKKNAWTPILFWKTATQIKTSQSCYVSLFPQQDQEDELCQNSVCLQKGRPVLRQMKNGSLKTELLLPTFLSQQDCSPSLQITMLEIKCSSTADLCI